MRAPPPIRSTKFTKLTIAYWKLKNVANGQRWKKHSNKAKLYKTQYKEKIRKKGDRSTLLSPAPSIRAEDMVNEPTGLLRQSAKLKPLLITTFPRGCDHSPRVSVLQRSKLSRLLLTRRKYKLKYYDPNLLNDCKMNDDIYPTSHACAQTVRRIKELTSRNADVRIVYHGNDIVKTVNIIDPNKNQMKNSDMKQQGSLLLQFGENYSLDLNQYKSLRTNYQKHKEQPVPLNALFDDIPLKISVNPDAESAKVEIKNQSCNVLNLHSNSGNKPGTRVFNLNFLEGMRNKTDRLVCISYSKTY